MSTFRNLMASVSVAAALGLSAGSATAAFLPFSITEGPAIITGTSANTVSGIGKMVGGYSEIFETKTFNPITGAGTFTTAAYWNAGQFFDTTGGNELTGLSQLGPVVPGGETVNTSAYALYALFVSTGTFQITGNQTTFTGTTGQIYLYADPSRNTVKNLNNDGDALPTRTGAGEDILLASTTVFISGDGEQLQGTQFKGGFALRFGELALSPIGAQYFSSPDPFYMVVDITGQFNPFDPSLIRPTLLNGSADVFFNVPEPASLALLGLGLACIGAISRRRRS